MDDEAKRIKKVTAGTIVRWRFPDSWPEAEKVTVQPSCTAAKNGKWYCCTHEKTFANQMQKDFHIETGKHTLAWFCFDHGVEEP